MPMGAPIRTAVAKASSATGRYAGGSNGMRPPRPGRLARPAAASGQWPLARSASAGVRERKMPGRASPVTTRLPSAPLSIARDML